MCPAYSMFLLFLPSFKKNLIDFFCHSVFSLSTRLEVIFYVSVPLKVTLASSACIVKKSRVNQCIYMLFFMFHSFKVSKYMVIYK